VKTFSKLNRFLKVPFVGDKGFDAADTLEKAKKTGGANWR